MKRILFFENHQRSFVSDEIARRTGIRHESPQAIVLKDEKVIYHASHYDVTAEDVEKRSEVRG